MDHVSGVCYAKIHQSQASALSNMDEKMFSSTVRVADVAGLYIRYRYV
jgi:hypothetical protein